MSKASDYILPIGLLAGVGIIGYLIYNAVKGSDIGQAVGAISGGVGSVVSGTTQQAGNVADIITFPKDIVEAITEKKPVTQEKTTGFVQDTQKLTKPADMFFNPVDTIATVANVLVTGTKIATGGIESKPPVYSAADIAQSNAAYNALHPKPYIETTKSKTTAALLTNVNKLQTPVAQIQSYNVAPKVVKVGNAFKKVM